MTIPRILIIAGSDSGGGAGIQADIKTVTMLGGHAMTALTAITAQNTLGVQRVMPVPADMVLAQIDSVVSDIGVDAVKIGMIGSAETANAVADFLSKAPPLQGRGWGGAEPQAGAPLGQAPPPTPPLKGRGLGVPVVFDPVMIATSGSTLADAATIAAFGRLMEIAAIVTPNTPELESLSGRKIENEIDQSEAAEDLMVRTGCPAVLAKGGHLVEQGLTYGTDKDGKAFSYQNADRVFDYLYQLDDAGWQERAWDSRRLDTPHTHGTGCTLASAIGTGLGAGLPLDQAVDRGIRFVRAALLAAPGLGHGHGPMGHALGLAPFDALES